jgi:hypothetical protein
MYIFFIVYLATLTRSPFICIALNGLCGLVVRVPGYRSRGPGSIPGATRLFLGSSGSETGSTQPRDDN